MGSCKCVSAKYLHMEPNSAIFMEYNIDMERIIPHMCIFHGKAHPWIYQILRLLLPGIISIIIIKFDHLFLHIIY